MSNVSGPRQSQTEGHEPVSIGKMLTELCAYARDRLGDGEAASLLDYFHARNPALCEAYGVGYLPADFRKALPKPYRALLKDRRLRLGNSLLLPAVDEKGAVVDAMIVRQNTGKTFLPQPQGLLGARVASSHSNIVVVDSFPRLAYMWRFGHENTLLIRNLDDAKQNADRLAKSGVRSIVTQVWRDANKIAATFHKAGIHARVETPPKTISGSEMEPPSITDAVTAMDLKGVISEPVREEVIPVVEITDSISHHPVDEALVIEDVEKEPEETSQKSQEKLRYVGYDRRLELATFEYEDAKYEVEVSVESTSRLEVALRRHNKMHRDRLDLAVEAQRKRFASSAAMRTGLEFSLIESHLDEILDKARAIKNSLATPLEEATQPRITIAAKDQAAAMGVLKSPDLLTHIQRDLDHLGWVGEDDAKLLLYLAAISRKLPEPLWVALRASPGAGKTHGLDIVAALTPPEDLMQLTRLTDSALYYQDPESMRHKLLVIDEADSLTKDVVIALRVLKSRGALSLSHVQRDPATGEARANFLEANGPISVLTTTAGHVDEQLLSRCYELSVDESPEQTARILSMQRTLRASSDFHVHGPRRLALVHLHRNLQRLLQSLPVLIPFAERIQFPSSQVKHRREQERFLTLIEASALLHQYQRLRHENMIVADERDFEIAVRLSSSAYTADTGLSSKATMLLSLLEDSRLVDFTMEDLSALKADWTRYAFRAALRELMDLEYVLSPRGGRGRRRKYHLVSSVPLAGRETPLLVDLGGLGTNGEGWRPGFANSTTEEKAG